MAMVAITDLLKQKAYSLGWQHNTMVSFLAASRADPGLIPSVPENFVSKTIVDVAEVNQQCSLKKADRVLKMLIEPI